MTKSFRKYLELYIPLNDEDWESISRYFEYFSILKDQFVLEEDQTCRYLYFLESGVLRFYFLEDGKEITKFFTFPRQIFTSAKSFSRQIPAEESIQALTNASMLRISYEHIQQLYREVPQWSSLIRQILLEVSDATEALFIEANTKTAEDRYKDLLLEEPYIIREIPLKYVASYLGISPESLSRIRKKVKEEMSV